ncbi:hypothetical protein [Kamptonema animale]|uniref:hypothetical protein n=1 Tax=Kamptonema animale TaxID=92934 RepID=UPI00232AF3A6|nr:hypothetical protein [Kamptonema animale]
MLSSLARITISFKVTLPAARPGPVELGGAAAGGGAAGGAGGGGGAAALGTPGTGGLPPGGGGGGAPGTGGRGAGGRCDCVISALPCLGERLFGQRIYPGWARVN